MGAFLDKPKTEKETEAAAGNKLIAGASAMQGWRVDMEDAHAIVMEVPGVKDTSFFAVFDGHGGSLVSKHAAERVLARIQSTKEWANDAGALDAEAIGHAMVRGFLDLDDELRRLPDVVRGDDHSGATAISAFITPTHIIVANAGDSRSILIRGSRVVEMSYDHKPYNEGEERRIKAAGGTVHMRRVNGDLAVSRALGDFVYKHMVDLPAEQQQVSAEPEIRIEDRSVDQDQFLVIACDGIWDVMSNEEVCDYITARARTHLASAASKPGHSGIDAAWIKETCEALIDECLRLGSRDNMSVVLVALDGALSGSAFREGTGSSASSSSSADAGAVGGAGGSSSGSATSAAGSSDSSASSSGSDDATMLPAPGSASVTATGTGSGAHMDMSNLASTLPAATGTGTGNPAM